MALATGGDQILAYQGADASPAFAYALNDSGAGVWQTTASNSNTSALPTGLTNGTTAVALNDIDNAIYTGTTSGTRAALLASISNNANWTGSDTVRQTMPSGPFAVTDAPSCGGDSPPTVTATTPANGATNVAVSSDLTVTFSENVTVTGEWLQIACPTSGSRAVADTAVTGGSKTFTINPNTDFAASETQ